MAAPMLLDCPEDIRELIYSYLEIDECIALSQTCRQLEYDCWRITRIMDSSMWERENLFRKALTHTRRLRKLCVAEMDPTTLLERVIPHNSELQHLVVSYCDGFVLRSDLPALKSLAVLELEEIDSFNASTLESLVKLCPNLKKLYVHCNMEGDARLDCLTQLEHLQELDLSLPGLNMGVLAQLIGPSCKQPCWPLLESLVLTGFEEDDVGLVLCLAPQLRFLSLTDCFSTFEATPIFERLGVIEKLVLSRLDSLTNEALGAVQIGARHSLQSLSINACPLLSSPDFNSWIATLPNLKTLAISGCRDVRVEELAEKPFELKLGPNKQYMAM